VQSVVKLGSLLPLRGLAVAVLGMLETRAAGTGIHRIEAPKETDGALGVVK
jgi:hypothetical protein